MKNIQPTPYVFLQSFNDTAFNICGTIIQETRFSALKVAKGLAQGGKIIQIPGTFIWVNARVIGIQKITGEKLYMNERGYYNMENVNEFINRRHVTITLTDSTGLTLFAAVNSWDAANVAAKSVFKRRYWSDLYYNIKFHDGEEISGSIDLEPHSFHVPHINSIVTTHLRTFWGNISKLPAPKYGISETEIQYFGTLLNRLPKL